MSRRRGEFEHRTSIFEGAFRAWSHLGGLDPEDLEVSTASDLDPLSNPIGKDTRLVSGKKGEHREPAVNLDGSKRREYPYEPLPRAGLAHPYVQAILSPWLGPDADNDAIQLGLTTLRTWWQHRRKGESGSAIAALGTEKMKGVVEGYTRHFFTLAHCLIINDKEQPPRSLQSKMKELEKVRSKRNKKRAREDEAGKVNLVGLSTATQATVPTADSSAIAAGLAADLTNKNLTPLERLHVAQQRQLAVEGGIHTTLPLNDIVQPINPINPALPIIIIKNKCVPGKPDLPAIVEAINHQAAQLSHGGGLSSLIKQENDEVPNSVTSNFASGAGSQYGDPGYVPIIFISENGDTLLSMVVDGITCAHCVKIVETVLKGCNGNKSPIDGLLDAAADRVLCSVLIKIDRIGNAKRIAFEAARNLAMVGYTAKAKDMPISIEQDGKNVDVNLNQLFNAFDTVARNDPSDLFDWSIPCSCPDNGVLRDDCSRHGQMSTSIFEAFDGRRQMVCQFLSGSKLEPSSQGQQNEEEPHQQMQQRQQMMNNPFQPGQNVMPQAGIQHLNSGMDQNLPDMDSFDGSNGMGAVGGNDGELMMFDRRAQRNPSIISFGGNGLRHMSFTSEAQSFGRAMSGLSALSIDWENMDDFDVNVDHSSHIDGHIDGNSPGGTSPNDGIPSTVNGAPLMGAAGRRRSSLLRRSFVANPTFVANPDQGDPHVSFKV